jgi:predicted transcriptional regulator
MPPVRITANVEELVLQALEQNFVPVVDDRDMFMGIITRRSILSYCIEQGLLVDEEEDSVPWEKEA